MPGPTRTTVATVATAVLLTGTILAACDTGDGKTLRPATEPPPTTTTTSTVAPSSPIETVAPVAPTTAVPAGLRLLAPWADGGTIGEEYSCEGADASPPISWTGVPDGTVELAVVMLDVDALDATGRPFVHWLVTGLDPSVSSFAAGGVPPGAVERTTSFGDAAYGGPCPPPGETHRYELTVHALNQRVDGADDTATAEVVDRIGQVSIGSATVVATFAR